MATGDLRNNLLKFQSELKLLKYSTSVDLFGASRGDPAVFLPIIHHILLNYSGILARYFAEQSFDLYGKKDARFMESVYSLLRDEFNYKPSISRDQFFAMGFAERKLIFICDMGRMCRELVVSLKRTSRSNGQSKASSVHGGSLFTNGQSTHSLAVPEPIVHSHCHASRPFSSHHASSSLGSAHSGLKESPSVWTADTLHFSTNGSMGSLNKKPTPTQTHPNYVYVQQHQAVNTQVPQSNISQTVDNHSISLNQYRVFEHGHDTELEAIYDESIVHEPQIPPAPAPAPNPDLIPILLEQPPTQNTATASTGMPPQQLLNSFIIGQSQHTPTKNNHGNHSAAPRSILKTSPQKSPIRSDTNHSNFTSSSQVDIQTRSMRLSPKKFRIVESISQDEHLASYRYYPLEWGQRDDYPSTFIGERLVDTPKANINSCRIDGDAGARDILFPDSPSEKEPGSPTKPSDAGHLENPAIFDHSTVGETPISRKEFEDMTASLKTMTSKNTELEKITQTLVQRIEAMQHQINSLLDSRTKHQETLDVIPSNVLASDLNVQPAVPNQRKLEHHKPLFVEPINTDAAPISSARLDISQRILNIQQRISDTSRLLNQPAASVLH
ncbi:hypothetical protein BATDEDRAFT_85549 [Batrachochytrium dendrobatidis JAM81]|uniref:Centrosomal protein of 44 kDa n=1 Tax=Batrachochytrium dendrobatidis (strain JAM81 / FGSC 10211) TaxID=684364 RepID=F4NTD4_BATDJ|nr:uncharacterized protein BATDEDRAFT_85549 [Batrachochytrium dendrobatidis JAM81]EGF83898.1 hypothetical protein BATDEDRAFT_85549 [Batrachochytrium dendrobatidis JAM81]|eukprot:XP_006676268.1 hypothetical protein BATDEDRAFT_85549 [Batrachochytrium dendrobatidis JAM81]